MQSGRVSTLALLGLRFSARLLPPVCLSAIELIRESWSVPITCCVRNFKDLKVWERSHRLVLDVYDATGRFPSEETFGLTAQLRRCCASIPTNIAEACGRSGEAELSRFMLISMGSASELEYQLLLARDLGYVSAPITRNSRKKRERSSECSRPS